MEWKKGIGAKAVIECTEDIPCNPCTTCCSRNAITMDSSSITSLPSVDISLCSGCGICVANCPGMAIFVVDKDKGTVAFPYEFEPMPEQGKRVSATDRDGKIVCDGVVVKVMESSSFDHTAVITVEVPVEMTGNVRGIVNPLKGAYHE